MKKENEKIDLCYDWHGSSLFNLNLHKHTSFFNSVGKKVASWKDVYEYLKQFDLLDFNPLRNLAYKSPTSFLLSDVFISNKIYDRDYVFVNNKSNKGKSVICRNFMNGALEVIPYSFDWVTSKKLRSLELDVVPHLLDEINKEKNSKNKHALEEEKKPISVLKPFKGFSDDLENKVYHFLKVLFDTNDSKEVLLSTLSGLFPSEFSSKFFIQYRGDLYEDKIIHLNILRGKRKRNGFDYAFNIDIASLKETKGLAFYVV